MDGMGDVYETGIKQPSHDVGDLEVICENI